MLTDVSECGSKGLHNAAAAAGGRVRGWCVTRARRRGARARGGRSAGRAGRRDTRTARDRYRGLTRAIAKYRTPVAAPLHRCTQITHLPMSPATIA